MSLNGVEEGMIPEKNDPIFKNDFKGKAQKGGRTEALIIIEKRREYDKNKKRKKKGK